MARQIGDIIITGTIDDITFYEMDGQGYARRKSSLTGKKVKRDPRFKRTMESAQRLAKGSQLASRVYRSQPRPKQVYALFQALKSIAVLAIKEGKSEEEVLALLQQQIGKAKGATKTKAVTHRPDLWRQTAPRKKTSRLFRVYGNRGKEVNRWGRKRRRLVCQTCAGKHYQQQRE